MNPEPSSQESQSTAVDSRRFAFGQNWQKFRVQLNESRLARARESLLEFWPVPAGEPVRFLDIGSGSGLMSLAAYQLGAEVVSFDYDADSVACTRALRDECGAAEPTWRVEAGSVLDRDYLDSLGKFDIVYSWGVLHHTGSMWRALENALVPLQPGGLLVIAIYNDQGWKSRFWKQVKQFYCRGTLARGLTQLIFVPGFLIAFFLADLLRGRNPARRYRAQHDSRGMSVVTDIIDWIGGYPFEVAKPEELIAFYHAHGLTLKQQRLTSGLGCNEFVFVRDEA